MKADYDSIAEAWNTARKVLPSKDRTLFDLFIERLPKQARILDLGCGHGVPVAKLLVEKGFHVTGVDRSIKLLALARLNVPEASFQKAEIEDFEINDIFNGVVLWDALFHIPREKHRQILTRVFDVLTTNGIFILSCGGCEKNLAPFTDCMFGVEFFYDSYPVSELLQLCESIGFTVIKHELVNQPDGGRDKGRLGAVFAKL